VIALAWEKYVIRTSASTLRFRVSSYSIRLNAEGKQVWYRCKRPDRFVNLPTTKNKSGYESLNMMRVLKEYCSIAGATYVRSISVANAAIVQEHLQVSGVELLGCMQYEPEELPC
jgi:hypothetical protein